MSGLFLRSRAAADFDAAELRGLRFRHAQLNSCACGGFAHGHNFLEGRGSVDKRNHAIAKRSLGAHHGLHEEIGDVDGSKSHRN